MPVSMQRALCPAEIRQYDASAFGVEGREEYVEEELLEEEEEEVLVEEEDGGEEEDEGGGVVRVVNKLSLKYFRERLVEHFKILFHRGELEWPQRRGDTPPVF